MATNNAINASTNKWCKSVVTTVFAAGTSTYTPNANLIACIVEIVGGGGSGGGVSGNSGANAAAGGGGCSAGYCRKTYTAAQIGASATVVVGSGGTGASSGANNGNAGGNSTFTPSGGGATLTANGGGGGAAMAFTTGNATSSFFGNPGSASNGDINIAGQYGAIGWISTASTALAYSGFGASTPLGIGGYPSIVSTGNSGAGPAGTGYGSGSAGAIQFGGTSQGTAAGQAGVCIVTEFISV